MTQRKPNTKQFQPSQDQDRPQDELHLYSQVVGPQTDDEFLQENNLGLGQYDKDEYWQQVKSFKDGLYARSAFSERLFRRAVKETVFGLGKEAWDDLPETADSAVVACPECELTFRFGEVKTDFECLDESCGARIAVDEEWRPTAKANTDRRRYIIREGKRRWNAIDQEAENQQAAQARRQELLQHHAGTADKWLPPQMRMMMMRHEASRSMGARLLDNLFERVKEMKGDARQEASSLMPGRSSGGDR
jgi:hypothetical protein